MRLTVVGSGTAAPEPERVCAAFFLEAGSSRILLDCGPGAVHHMARFQVPWQRLDHLVISHFHNDHIGDIPMLLFALRWGAAEPRSEPLRVWGPAGLRDRFRRMAAAFGDHVTEPGFVLLLEELEPGATVELDEGVALACAATPHTPESLAFRVDTRSASLGYTGDTGPDHELSPFLASLDLLIAECSVPDDQAMDNHLTPSSLAALARDTEPGRLLVTHVYPSLGGQDVAALLRAAGWAGKTVRASDGLRIQLSESATEE